MEQLGLIDISKDEKGSRIILSDEGQEFIAIRNTGYNIITTMPGECTIYSAIAYVLYGSEREVYIVSPWINGTMVSLLEKTLAVKLREILGYIWFMDRETVF